MHPDSGRNSGAAGRLAEVVEDHTRTSRRELLLASLAAAGASFVPLAAPARASAATGGVALGGWRRDASGALRSAVVERPFSLAGVAWRGASPGPVEVRALRDGRWSRWTGLSTCSLHGPDGARARCATDPWWSGPAEAAQVRVRRVSPALRLHLLDSTPVPRARAAQVVAPPPGAPSILPRSAWGGERVPPRDPADLGRVDLAFVHHTVTTNDYTSSESPQIVQGIARYHRDVNGWDDIGYQFLVDRFGTIFEGRAGGIDQAVVGAQAQGFNAVSFGVACLGTFGSDGVPDPVVEALAQLIAWKLVAHGAAPSGTVAVRSAGGSTNRFPKGTEVVLDRVSGHRDGNATACPGDALYAQLPALRARVAARAGALAAPAVARGPLEAAAASRRVRASGAGVLVRGRGAAGDVRLSVSRKVASGAYALGRRVSLAPKADGSFAARVPLHRPGLYRIAVRSGGERVDVYVRSVRSRRRRRRSRPVRRPVRRGGATGGTAPS